MAEIFATTIFCDDVRHEVGGKMSFIGIYNQDLVLPYFPATLTKIFLVVDLCFLKDTIQPDSMDILIELPDGQSEAFSYDLSEIRAPNPVPEWVSLLKLRTLVEISPFNVTMPGSVLVKVRLPSGEIGAGGLVIRYG